MWDAIYVFWIGLGDQLQGAMIGALTTVATATLGAAAVIWQIGRQARHAIQQNRHNESLKLKLDLYREILAVCDAASEAEIALSTYVTKFLSDVELARTFAQRGAPYSSAPRARASDLSDMNHSFRRKAIEIVAVTEKWEIIDLRLSVFRWAINSGTCDAEEAFGAYFHLAVRLMAHEMPQPAPPGAVFPWAIPNDADISALQGATKALCSRLMDVGSYTSDFRVEMQNLLLGEIFEHTLPPRKPLDPASIVVRLDRCDELTRYFETQTAWGRRYMESNADVKAKLTSRSTNATGDPAVG